MKNILLDLILIALFVAELSFFFLPKILHEIFGVAMFVAIVLHLAINFRRLLANVKNMNPRNFFSMEVNIALLLGTVLIFVTGVCMSNYLFPDFANWAVRRNMTIHNLHVSAPYIMMILIGMHLGVHWNEFWHRLLNLVGLTEFYQGHKKIFMVAAVLLSLVGFVGFFLNRLASRLAMKHIFATPATDFPPAVFMLMMLGGVAFFALVTFFVSKKFFR